jgi:hypothetical protein
MKNTTKSTENSKDAKDLFPLLTDYPSNDDIYNKLEKESEIDPEDISKNKEIIQIDKSHNWNEKNFNQDKSGDDLDVPGSELDNEEENNGNEDEENNSYSIGGDNHSNLDENKE